MSKAKWSDTIRFGCAKYPFRETAVALLAAPLLFACGNFPAYFKPVEAAKIDTGVVDYRHADEDGLFSYHFFPQECFKTGEPSDCDHEIKQTNRISANDAVSIKLLYGYICDFPEDARSWSELDRDYGDGKPVVPCWNDESRAGVKGEISVLATVFERDEKKKISWDQNELTDQNARVVYYSQDVRESGQPLNLSNLPMYGPVTYKGKPLYMRFSAVEMDQKEAKETAVLLRSLASLGAQAYPPASGILEALDSVGGAFLESQQDDLFFEYSMEFDGDGGVGPSTAPLAAGLLSFVRVQNRSQRFSWDDHCVDETTGIIHKKTGGVCKVTCSKIMPEPGRSQSVECGPDSSELRGYTYFTVKIMKNEPALSNDAYQTFAELNALTEEDVPLANAIGDYFSGLEAEIRKTANFDRARSLNVDIYSPSPVARAKSQDAMKDALCTGFDKDNKKFGDGRLEPDKRYKLLDWLEKQWNSEKKGLTGFDASEYLADTKAEILCSDPGHSGWSKLFAAKAD